METYIGIGILGVFFTVFAVAIVAGRRHAKAMKKFSGTIGFSYMPHADDDEKFLRQFNRLPLFSRGRNRDVWNVMTGKVLDFGVTIMEFRYSNNDASTHSTRSTSTQTVVILESGRLNIPLFSLAPHNNKDELGKKVFSALAPHFAKQLIPDDIDFDSYPLFSKFYLLKGSRKNEEVVRKFFNSNVIEYYENHKGLCTDGAGKAIMCYELDKVLNPEDISSFLNQTIKVCEMFQRAGGSTPPL